LYRGWRVLGAVAAGMFIFARVTRASPLIVDDGATNSRPVASNVPASGNVWNSLSQSFTAEDSMIAFGFRLKDISSDLPNAGASIVYNLYAGENSYATLLASRTVTLPSALASDARSIFGDVGFVDADLTAVTLTVGQKYTVEITVPAANLPMDGADTGFAVWTSLSDPYSGGRFFFPTGYNNDFFSAQDMLFRVTPAAAPEELEVSGSCRQPGPEGLVNCSDGTMITVSRCNNSSCDPTNLTVLGTSPVDASGSFSFTLSRQAAAGVRLIFAAAIVDGTTSGGTLSAQAAAPISYRVVAIGPAAAGAQLDGVLIDPVSEATTDLLTQQGLENYSDSSILQVIALGHAANTGNTFAGQSVAAAVATAEQTDLNDADFLAALANVRPFCLGDCNDDRSVAVNELVTLVNISLGALNLVACVPGNENADLQIAVNELVRAVNGALSGCPI
jgi:hypothetical protein